MTITGEAGPLAAGASAAATSPSSRQSATESRFYLRMAALFVLIAFGGFAPTYWIRIINGSIDVPPLIHIHGLLFFAWTLFYLLQTALIAQGRTLSHRSWGMAGIALFTAMICAVIAGQIAIMDINEARGFGDAGRRFAIFTFFDAASLSTFFTLAIINVRRPEWHKRFMIVLGIAMLPPAIGRVFVTIAGATPGGPPAPVIFGLAPNLVTDLLLIIPAQHDRRTLGRVHPIYLFAFAWLVVGKSLMIPIAATENWVHVATSLQRIAR